MLQHRAAALARLRAKGIEPWRSLPAPARWWWAVVVCVSLGLIPVCIAEPQPEVPLWVLVVAPLVNVLVVISTVPRRGRSTPMPSFDYGGIVTMALLAAFGPSAALLALVGEKVTGAVVADASGKRPLWIKSVYNFAWGSPCIVVSWWARTLAPEPSLQPAAVAIAWCLTNGFLVGTMVALASGRSPAEGMRIAVTQEGWLRVQEGAVGILAVVAWWSNRLLLLVVVLLVIGQAMTRRRLLREYERSAAAHALARQDPLTRLANRLAYEETLQRGAPHDAALVLDLDHFKRVNDTFGHEVGDRVLIEVAAATARTLGPSAFCARLGGEEFCALIDGISGDAELLELAERARAAVAALRFDGLTGLRTTVSVGVARRRAYEPTVREAVGRADQALYAAKRDGRNRAYVYSDRVLPLAS